MATETTLTSAKAWSPDVTAVGPREAVPDALILNTSTVAGVVNGDDPSVRVQYVDDAAAQITPEGDPIPEADPDLAEAVVSTVKVSQLIRMSREQYEQPNAQQLLSESVGRAVTKAGNVIYLTGATDPIGLENIAGTVQANVSGSLDGLIDMQAALATNGADAGNQVIVVSPTAWSNLRKIKRGEGSAESLLGVGAADAVPYLLDLPVLVSPAASPGTGLIVDKTAVVSAVGPVNVAVSDQAYFASDSVGIRCTWRIGWAAVKPDRVGVFVVSAETPAVQAASTTTSPTAKTTRAKKG